jgi:glutaredoxin-related protein
MYSSGPWYAINGVMMCDVCYRKGKCMPIRGIVLTSVSTRDLIAELETRDGVTKYPKWATSSEVFAHRETFPGDSILIKIVVNYLDGEELK